MKETVVIEYLDPVDVSKVAVVSYDNGSIGSVLEVCSKMEASENYDIVGELRDGKMKEFETEDYEDDTFYEDEDFED